MFPKVFFFELRRGVKFHEGETLTADDVVFSYERALSPQSQFKNSTTGILGAEKKGDYTVLVKTVNGSPVLLNQMTDLRILCKSWAEKHDAVTPQDFINKKEAWTARHANGTGPFKLKSREVDVKTVFEATTVGGIRRTARATSPKRFTPRFSPQRRERRRCSRTKCSVCSIPRRRIWRA